MSQTTAKHLVHGLTVNPPVSQQPQGTVQVQSLQPTPLSQNENCQESKVVYIVVEVPEQSIQRQKKKMTAEGGCIITPKPGYPKPKVRITPRKGRIATAPTAQGSSEISRCSASKENVEKAQVGTNRYDPTMGSARSKAGLVNSTESVYIQGRGWVAKQNVERDTGLDATGLTVMEEIASPAEVVKQDEGVAVTVSTPKSTLTNLLTSPDLDLLAPMATSTPLSRNLKKRSSVETESHLPKTAKVSLQFKLNSSSLQESGVHTSQTIPVPSSSSIPENPSLAESPLVAAHHSDPPTFSPLFSASTRLSQTSSASMLHHSKNQLSGETVQTTPASQMSIFSQTSSSTEKRRVTVKGRSQDSGLGMSVLSQVLTSASTAEEVSKVRHGATGFSSLEDSNQKLVVKNLSDGSLDEESSNSQGGDGELNTSLTKMHWLKDYALKKKVLGSEHLLFPEGPANRRLEARQKKDMCSCGILREAIAKKPGYTYKHMIQMSMVSKKNKPMMAQEIRTYFTKNWAFFKSHQTCLFWQNAIRHNLSSNDCFLKCPDRKGYWYLDPEEYQELKLKEASLLNANQGRISQVLDPVLVGQSTQPIVFSSALPTATLTSGPSSSFGNTGVLRRTGYAPILPCQVLNISNQSPALIQQNSPVYIHYPAISVQPAPFPAITMSSTLPKRPLPPLPSTSRRTTSSCKKAKPVRGKNRGKASASSKDSQMKKTKSSGDVGVHGDLIAQAALESGLLGGNLCSKDDDSGASFSSLSNHSGVDSNNHGEAGPHKHTATDSNAGCLVLPRSASVPPILSKRRKVVPPTNVPVVHNISVSPQRRTCSNPPHHQQQRSRGRRKQNLLLASNKDTELIITGSGAGKEVATEAEQPDLHATDSSGDNVVDTSLSLTGLEAAQFQVSSLMSPTPRDSPEPPPIPLESPTSALAPVAGNQKREVEPVPSPISSGTSLSVESVHADDSGLIMVDFAQCSIDNSNKKLVVSPNKSSTSFDLSVLNTPPSKSWPLKSPTPTTPSDFNFDFVNYVFKHGQLRRDSDQQGVSTTMTTQPHSQQDDTTDQSSCSWQPTFQSNTVNKEKSKPGQLVCNQQLNGLQHQQEENDWLIEYLGTLPATTSGPSQLLNTPQTSLAHADHFLHASEWHLPSSQFTYQSQQAQHPQIHQFSSQTQVPKQNYVPNSQSEWRPSSAPANSLQSSSNQGLSALHQDTSLLQLPQQLNSIHEVNENSALRDSALCFHQQFTKGTAPILPTSQVASDCHGAMSFSANVTSEHSNSNFEQFSFAGPVQLSGNSNASRENNIDCSSYGSCHDVACSSSVSDKKPYMQFETTNSDGKPTVESSHLNISLDISCFDDLQTSLQNNSFPSQCASNGSPTLHSAEVPSFHSAELSSFHSTEFPSFHSIGSPTFHGAGSPSFHDAGSPGFHATLSSSFHSSMLPSFQKGSHPAQSLQKQNSVVTDSTESGTSLGYNFACDNSPLSSLYNQDGGDSVYSALDEMSNIKFNQNVDLHQQPRNNVQQHQQQQNYMYTLQSQPSGMPAFLANVANDLQVPVKQEQ